MTAATARGQPGPASSAALIDNHRGRYGRLHPEAAGGLAAILAPQPARCPV